MHNNEWVLDPILERDSLFIANLNICQLRLMNNKLYPWVILVPRIAEIVEITDLHGTTYLEVMKETQMAARIIQQLSSPTKLNIASIGNIVKQLHIHVIARFKDDSLFPKVVWGNEFTPYDVATIEAIILSWLNALKE